jgi:UDP-N-acetylmuramate: L-alanyl-gamma-D-glutamyl-meso-diaminopimelate ligase
VRLSADIAANGGSGFYLPDVESIVAKVAAEALPGDLIAVLSNGGFGGIHRKLLEALAAV